MAKLFSYIQELAEEEDKLVCVLIDEVESLAAARSAAVSGSEPSDSIRVVNALLTQIDRLKTRHNVMIFTTSNITAAIDVAFVDRADIRQYIGLPGPLVRRHILASCVQELCRSGVLMAAGDIQHQPGQQGQQGKGAGQLEGPPAAACAREGQGTVLALSDEEEVLLQSCAELTEGLSGRGLRKLPFQAHARFVRSRTQTSVASFLRALAATARAEAAAKVHFE